MTSWPVVFPVVLSAPGVVCQSPSQNPNEIGMEKSQTYDHIIMNTSNRIMGRLLNEGGSPPRFLLWVDPWHCLVMVAELGRSGPRYRL